MVSRIRIRRDEVANWMAANPILAEAEPGLDKDAERLKVGDGITPWNDLPYFTEIHAASAGYTFFDDVGQPLAPDRWVAVTEVREVSYNGLGWSLGPVIDLIGPAGPGYVMVGVARQPAARFDLQPYNQTVHLKASAVAATLPSFGSTTTIVTGTQSAVAAAQNSPNASRIVTSGAAAEAAGVRSLANLACIGAPTDWAVSGFNVSHTLRWNDASYNEAGASTGSRIAVGLAGANAMNVILATDELDTGNFLGFIRRSVNGGAIDANWQLITRAGALPSSTGTQDTGVPFVAGNWYTLSFWMAPGGTVMGWRIVNHTAGTTTTGAWTLPVLKTPGPSAMMGTFAGVFSVNAVARNMDVNGLSLVT